MPDRNMTYGPLPHGRRSPRCARRCFPRTRRFLIPRPAQGIHLPTPGRHRSDPTICPSGRMGGRPQIRKATQARSTPGTRPSQATGPRRKRSCDTGRCHVFTIRSTCDAFQSLAAGLRSEPCPTGTGKRCLLDELLELSEGPDLLDVVTQNRVAGHHGVPGVPVPAGLRIQPERCP